MLSYHTEAWSLNDYTRTEEKHTALQKDETEKRALSQLKLKTYRMIKASVFRKYWSVSNLLPSQPSFKIWNTFLYNSKHIILGTRKSVVFVLFWFIKWRRKIYPTILMLTQEKFFVILIVPMCLVFTFWSKWESQWKQYDC